MKNKIDIKFKGQLRNLLIDNYGTPLRLGIQNTLENCINNKGEELW